MRTLLATALLGLLVVAAPLSQERDQASNSLTRAFRSGGRIVMDLSAGEYRLVGTAADAITVTWSTRDRDRLDRVRTLVDVQGGEAVIEVDGPRSRNRDDDNHLAVLIEVPARSDLDVRLSAGEMDIAGIRGHKYVRLQAGKLTIGVGRASDYGRVEASVWAGEVEATPFGRHTEGLFRSLDWEGNGPYRLEAHLKAGEIRFR